MCDIQCLMSIEDIVWYLESEIDLGTVKLFFVRCSSFQMPGNLRQLSRSIVDQLSKATSDLLCGAMQSDGKSGCQGPNHVGRLDLSRQLPRCHSSWRCWFGCDCSRAVEIWFYSQDVPKIWSKESCGRIKPWMLENPFPSDLFECMNEAYKAFSLISPYYHILPLHNNISNSKS